MKIRLPWGFSGLTFLLLNTGVEDSGISSKLIATQPNLNPSSIVLPAPKAS